MQIIDGIQKFTDKFEDENFEYRRKRRALAEELQKPDFWDPIDNFGLLAGEQTIARAMAMFELVKLSAGTPGHIAEFGVWNGNNLLLVAKLLRLLQPNTYKHLYGFDSFVGLTDVTEKDTRDPSAASHGQYQGMYKGDRARLERMISFFGYEEWVHLVVGDARETIPAFADRHPNVMLSMAILDFDLYEPTKAALGFVHDRILPGGLVVFDEAMSQAWAGEGTAAVEFLREYGHLYETGHIPFSRMPTMYLRRK